MTDWKQEYKRRYAELKEAGKPFFPYTVFKDTLAVVLVFALVVFLAYRFGAGLEDLADPTDTTYNPRPEWYFLFLFQALKFFPGRFEAVAAVILPGLGMLGLALLPFWDSGPSRHPLSRPWVTGLGVLVLISVGALTWEGFRSPLTNPTIEKDPKVSAGQRIFRDMKCSYCHKISGQGGTLGPRLDQIANEKSEEWLAKHFRDPQAVTPGSKMPKLNLLDDEIQDLIAYLKSMGGPEPFTQEAPNLFAANCAVCHRIGKEGGEVGPDLSFIGSARDKTYIRRYVHDPSMLNPKATMPAFKGQLTDIQIEDIARYLASLK